MNTSTVSFPATAIVLGLVCFGAPAQSKTGDDTIRRTNGQVIRKVEVLSETLTTVTYRKKKKEETLPASDVREVEWAGAGETYSRATFAASRGDHALAANLFKETADKASREGLKAHAAFKAGEALYLASIGDVSQAPLAANALTSWVGANAEHRLMPAARHLLGQSWLVAGNADEAIAAMTELEKIATEKNLGAAWVARAKFGKAEALVKKKDFANARSSYVSASATLSAVDPKVDRAVGALLVGAKVGEGECLLAEKRYPDARRFFSTLSNQAGSDQPALAAAAKCGEAQATFEEAAAKKDKSGLRTAQEMFASVSATDMTDGDASAKATYFLGKVLIAIGKDGEGSDFANRADRFFRVVVEQYPNSRWAVRARQALKR